MICDTSLWAVKRSIAVLIVITAEYIPYQKKKKNRDRFFKLHTNLSFIMKILYIIMDVIGTPDKTQCINLQEKKNCH